MSKRAGRRMNVGDIVELLRRTGYVIAVASTSVGRAQVPATLTPVEVIGRSTDLVGAADSATEGVVTGAQLTRRPLLRPAEVLESVPGLIVTQHSGDGKANQYFLRGFNLDHGSDFASFVNGMPVNNVSHAHGQGYMDLNFLIPELIDRMRYRKGPYSAEDGDFAVTGSARIDDVRSLPAPFVDVTFGEHRHRRLLTGGSTLLDNGMTLLGAVELGETDGPWEEPERLRKVNTVVRLSSGTVANSYSLTAMTYRAAWTATEHVPERAIVQGEIGRYGTLSPTDGGRTYRNSLSGEWARSGEDGKTRANVYLVGYGLNLFSSPSGVQDPQHEQEDRRNILGGAVSHNWALGDAWPDTDATVGLQVRHDRLPHVGLFDTVDRIRTETVREDRVDETAVGLYGELHTQWRPWFRSTIGARLDHVRGRVSPLGGAHNGANGGTAEGSQISPKLALIAGPFGSTEFYANAGTGFHSNDLRGATSTINPTDGGAVDRVRPLAKARSMELGMRTTLLPGWTTSLSIWKTELDSELVFIGDEGVTEPRGASRRHGVEWSNDYAVNSWLGLNADLAVSHARFAVASNGGRHVPNAIPVSASVGVLLDGHGAWFGGLRLRYIGAYPLEETGTQKSTAFLTANLKVGYRVTPKTRISLDVLNVFDRKANDIEYWGTSCTGSEGAGCNGGAGFDGRLLHPLEPRTLRVSLHASF